MWNDDTDPDDDDYDDFDDDDDDDDDDNDNYDDDYEDENYDDVVYRRWSLPSFKLNITFRQESLYKWHLTYKVMDEEMTLIIMVIMILWYNIANDALGHRNPLTKLPDIEFG